MERQHRGDPVATLERELLARLGLGPDASADEVSAAHQAVVSFLAAAPAAARGWARAQAAAADEAMATLSDPRALAERAESATLTPGPTPPRPAPVVRRAAATPPAAAPTEERPLAADDVLDDLIAEVTPSAHRDEVRRPSAKATATARRTGSTRPRLPSRRTLSIAGAVAGIAVVLFVVSGFAHSSIPAAPGLAESQGPAALDEPAVAALMERIQADPADSDALMELGDAFFAGGQYQVAAEWLGRLVELEPDNVRALLALGAAQFNSGDDTAAEDSWSRVVDLDPGNVEAHYDLGFLYLQADPPDLDRMQSEWQTVVELAPGTQVAESVQAHLAALASVQPSADATDQAP